MNAQNGLSRREFRISVLAGVVTALLVVVAGAFLALTTPTKWTAESALVVLPGADLNASDSAAYYETLSRGQIVATFAEVADNLRFQQQAEQSLQLSEAQRAGVTTTVSVVPDTSVILVRTTAGTAAVAEQMADATTTLASKYLAGLSKPYRTELVHTAEGSAFSSGTSPTTCWCSPSSWRWWPGSRSSRRCTTCSWRCGNRGGGTGNRQSQMTSAASNSP